MKYLENAIRFLVKNWLLAVPLFILTAIPALFTGFSSSLGQVTRLWSSLANPYGLTDPTEFLKIIPGIIFGLLAGAALTWVFQFIAYPVTYGLVNKGLDTGSAGMNDMGQALSQNFVKYLLYFVGRAIVWIIFSIAAGIVLGILFLILGLLGGFGIFLWVLICIAVGIAAIVLGILLSLWLPVMVIDNLDVVNAAKKSIEVAKSSFWTIVGISILVAIAGGIAGAILGLLTVIPLIGAIIASVVPTATSFVMIVFYMLLYRDKTGRANSI